MKGGESMVSIKTTQLSKNKVGITVFNEFNEVVAGGRKMITDVEKLPSKIEKLRKAYMITGHSVFYDKTIY